MSKNIQNLINVYKTFGDLSKITATDIWNSVSPFITPSMKIYLNYMSSKYMFGHKVKYMKENKNNFKLSTVDNCCICFENKQLYSFPCDDKHTCCYNCIQQTPICYHCRYNFKNIKIDQQIFETILASYHQHYILNKKQFELCDIDISFSLLVYMSIYH